jgi:hypothetical protein
MFVLSQGLEKITSSFPILGNYHPRYGLAAAAPLTHT